jgi:hypothetical protein
MAESLLHHGKAEAQPYLMAPRKRAASVRQEEIAMNHHPTARHRIEARSKPDGGGDVSTVAVLADEVNGHGIIAERHRRECLLGDGVHDIDVVAVLRISDDGVVTGGRCGELYRSERR